MTEVAIFSGNTVNWRSFLPSVRAIDSSFLRRQNTLYLYNCLLLTLAPAAVAYSRASKPSAGRAGALSHFVCTGIYVSSMTVNADSLAGAAIYTRNTLKLYDFWVHGFSNRYLWNCPTEHLHALYQRHTSANHLEVGAGTGFFLKQTPFRVLKPRIVLMDLNPVTLETASAALKHYQPAGVLNDVLADQQPDLPPFDSIAFNYVWHCLPAGNKERAFANLAQLLIDDGVLFGATLLGQDVALNPLARATMALYRRKGIFGNGDDSRAALETALARHFRRYEIRQEGAAALFSAWK